MAITIFLFKFQRINGQQLDRWKLFLKSDLEYQWHRSDIPLWTLLLTPVILALLICLMVFVFLVSEDLSSWVSKIGISTAETDFIPYVAVALIIPLLLLTEYIIQRLKKMDPRVYPFANQAEYDSTLRQWE